MTNPSTTFMVLPGWNNSGAAHWQTLWPQAHADAACFVRVEQDDWHWPKRGDWMMRLDETLLALSAPSGQSSQPDQPDQPDQPNGGRVVLLAHSLGCHLVAAWAAHSQHTGRVQGAWLVAPPDLDGADRLASLPPQLHGWRAVVRQRLPWPAHVLASASDPYSSLERSAQLAHDWGATWESLGEAGHVNADSGHGAWPQGWARLQQWRQHL